MNKRNIIAFFLVLAVALWPLAQADADSQYKQAHRQTWQKILSQLPEEKGNLLRATMKETREKTAPLQAEIRKSRAELREMLTAPQFDEFAFKEKAKRVRELRDNERQVMEEAVIRLARQFTPEERQILAKLVAVPKHPHRHRAH